MGSGGDQSPPVERHRSASPIRPGEMSWRPPSDAGGADEDSAAGLPADNDLDDQRRVIWVTDNLGGVRADVAGRDPQRAEMLGDGELEFVTAVVIANPDVFHAYDLTVEGAGTAVTGSILPATSRTIKNDAGCISPAIRETGE